MVTFPLCAPDGVTIPTDGLWFTSSLKIVPVAVGVMIWALPEGPESVTVKPSSGSSTVSPLTLIVSVLLVSPAEKFTWPLGIMPPKSAALAGLSRCR